MMQQAIKQHGNGLGLRAKVEAELPDKSGSVDVLLEGASLRIAFEVAERSPLEQELRNIVKSLDAGIPEVVIVSEDTKRLFRISEEAARHIDGARMKRVAFIPFDEIGSYFAALGARMASTETNSRGYKVKVNFAPAEEGTQEAKTREIHRAVAVNVDSRKEEG